MPTIHKDIASLKAALNGVAAIEGNAVKVSDKKKFVERTIDDLVHTSVFGPDDAVKNAARWIIRAAANDLGALTASIQGLYDAFAAGKVKGFTVPAHNIRGLAYDKARALFRTAKALDAGAFIFEIAKSEMGYCHLQPAEYAPCILAGAIKEGWQGPVFIH